MNKKIATLTAIGLVAAVLWAFVGVDRIVSDHEIGVAWKPFFKQRPGTQIIFSNPAARNLEIVPFAGMTNSEQQAVIEYCAVRFGESDISNCYAFMAGQQL